MILVGLKRILIELGMFSAERPNPILLKLFFDSFMCDKIPTVKGWLWGLLLAAYKSHDF